jgi:hypothetical protein
MALKSMAYVRSIKEVMELNKTHFLLKIDIEKAFDSLPHSIILRTLRKLFIPQNIIEYIMNFI